MRGQRNEPMQIFLKLIKALFVVECLANVLLPVRSDRMIGLSLIHICSIGVCIYALLASFGYVKKIVDIGEDGSVQYEAPIPIVQLFALRILEFVIYMMLHREVFEYFTFITLVVVDVVYVLLLLLDKSNYYYVSGEVED